MLLDDRRRVFDQLVQDEALRLSAYTDARGYLTIGVGRLIDPRGGGISISEAYYLLDHDLDRSMTDCARCVPGWASLTPPRQAVLVQLRFQLGLSGLLGFRRMLAALVAGDYPTAAKELRESQLATQAPARTARHARQLETGQWPR